MPILEPSTSKPAARPKTQIMVDNALKTLNERTGSSVVAIKKFITNAYNIDMDKSSASIKRYIKASLESGKFVQTKGKGIAGSFRLSLAAKKEPKAKTKVKKSKEKVKGVKGTAKKEADVKKTKKTNTEGKENEVAEPKAKKITTTKEEGAVKKVTTSKTKTTTEKVKDKAPLVKKPAKKKEKPSDLDENLKPPKGTDPAVKNNTLKEINGSAEEKLPKKMAAGKKKGAELGNITNSTPLKPIVVNKDLKEKNTLKESTESVDEISEGLDVSPLKDEPDDDVFESDEESQEQNEAPTKKKAKKGKKSIAKRKSIATLILPMKAGKYSKK